MIYLSGVLTYSSWRAAAAWNNVTVSGEVVWRYPAVVVGRCFNEVIPQGLILARLWGRGMIGDKPGREREGSGRASFFLFSTYVMGNNATLPALLYLVGLLLLLLLHYYILCLFVFIYV